MPTELEVLISNLEASIEDTMGQMSRSELNLLYVDVLDLEKRIETLNDALHLVADRVPAGGSHRR